MHHEPTRSEYSRLNCRVSSRIKHQAEEAAAILGQSITDFTESALADKAQAVLENYQRLVFSERDFAAFVMAIESPTAPTQVLREALSEYKTRAEESPEANL